MNPEARRARDYEVTSNMYDADRLVDELIAMDPGPQNLNVVPVEVQKWFRGQTPGVMYLLDPAAVGIEPGRTYVMYANRYVTKPSGASEALVLVTAHAVKESEGAAEDLEFLQGLASAQDGATIYGTLRGARGKNPENYEPLPGIPIEFIFEGVGVRTIAGRYGTFIVTGVPDGRVEVRPSLPAGLTLRDRVFKTVERGGCVSSDMVAVVDGRVRGIVLPEQNVSYEFIELALMSEKQAYTARPNEYGEFEFVGVVPGEYVLGTQLSKPFRPKALCESMPPTYYPGTNDRGQAERITVGFGEHLDGFNFVARCDPSPPVP